MNRSSENLLYYTAVDREFFEPTASREIESSDFLDRVRIALPSTWDVARIGFWIRCLAPDDNLPVQGWKIHISSIAPTARAVLSVVTEVMLAQCASFKFAADVRMHNALNSKRWSRGGAGKFITVYPTDIDHFRRLLGALYVALAGYSGPYILSDRRYLDSRVIYYRYGGIKGEYRINASGRKDMLLQTPKGDYVIDERGSSFKLPDWLRDPFPAQPLASPPIPCLKNGRYRIECAIAHSAAGGAYRAMDLDTGRRVFIKEARPFVGTPYAATALLRKEHRLLRKLTELRVAPAAVDFFEEWEHMFLVEEFLDGETMRGHLAKHYPVLKTRATRHDAYRYMQSVCAVFLNFADALRKIHGAGVIVGDLSFHNTMVNPAGEVRFIDLEAASEEGIDDPVSIGTFGFVAESARQANHAPSRAEDYYAFGSNLLATLMPINAMLPLDRGAAGRFADVIVADMGYPTLLADSIVQLMSPDPEKRPKPWDVMVSLQKALIPVEGDAALLPVPYLAHPANATADPCEEMFAYISDAADRARHDCFVPADPEVFQTNAFGVAHGAAGVLHAYLRGRRTPPASVLDYLTSGIDQADPHERGSSLQTGDAGISWVLFEHGDHERASRLLTRTHNDRSILERADLYSGVAGWGLAQLKGFAETQLELFLDTAIEAGDRLLTSSIEVEDTLHWTNDNHVQIGLGYGAAGVSLFLLFLYCASGHTRFLKAGIKALDFDLKHHAPNPDGDPTWQTAIDSPTLVPYLCHGTAGIITVLMRFHRVTGDPRYLREIRSIEGDLFRKYAINPCLFSGLAGMGEVLLDLASFYPDREERYLEEARKVASGIEVFLLRRPSGLVTAGAELLRLSCDFGTGSAGIAAFYDRLWRGGKASFMLDYLLPRAAVLRGDSQIFSPAFA